MASQDEATVRPEEYARRREQVEGWDINVVSYRLGATYRCEIDNVSPGANIARGQGATRQEAETQALEQARRRLARTRRHSV